MSLITQAISQDIISVTRTVYGARVQTAKKLGLPYQFVANTTLNERFNVQAGVLPPPQLMPLAQYMVIGNLGHMTVQADDGSDETVPVPHRATDAALYGHVAFVRRRPTDDLPAELRSRYRLRVPETINGEQWIAYYARKISMTDVTTQMQQIEVEDGIVTASPFVPTTNNLNPPRPVIPNNGTVLGSKSYVGASSLLTIELDASDIAELLNAHRVLTGSTRSPVISEIGLCSAVDRTVEASTGGSGTFSYTEALVCQVDVHISTYQALGYSSRRAVFNLDVGGVEPLLGENDAMNALFV